VYLRHISHYKKKRHMSKEKHRKGQYDAKPNSINVSCVWNKFGIEYELIFNFCLKYINLLCWAHPWFCP
jgi:hypothetical protein